MFKDRFRVIVYAAVFVTFDVLELLSFCDDASYRVWRSSRWNSANQKSVATHRVSESLLFRK